MGRTSSDGRPQGPTAGPDRVLARANTTFKPRRRALSSTRQADFEMWLRKWGLDETGPTLEWSSVFAEESGAPGVLPVILDIGFGRGEGTIEMARADPGTAVVGVEVHTPGVAAVLDAIEHDPLPHVRVVHGDVLRFLKRVAPSSLAGVRIYFPDPWPKQRHRDRRLVRADLLEVLIDRLDVGGTLHLATDVASYAAEMRAVCDAEPRLTGGPIDRPDWRTLTRFEQRGLDEGRLPTDLWYEKTI